MSKEFNDIIPLSESNVSLKLEEIRRRCSELLDEPNLLDGLSLEDSDDAPMPVPGRDPYNQS